MGTLLHSCAEVREPIELSFGVVSGIGSGIHILDGCARVKRKGLILGLCADIGPMVLVA